MAWNGGVSKGARQGLGRWSGSPIALIGIAAAAEGAVDAGAGVVIETGHRLLKRGGLDLKRASKGADIGRRDQIARALPRLRRKRKRRDRPQAVTAEKSVVAKQKTGLLRRRVAEHGTH